MAFFVRFSDGLRYRGRNQERIGYMNIALMGYSRSGKDTVGEMIITHLHENMQGVAKRFAFGDELRSRLYKAFPDLKRMEKKPREITEQFAQLGRDIDEDMWVNALHQDLYFTLNNPFYHNIITDLRQPNEAEYCRKNGFKIVEVFAPESVRKERSNGDTNWNPVNYSERFLHNIEPDYVIHNLYNKQHIEDQVKIMLGRLF